jgi:hypothetical protein
MALRLLAKTATLSSVLIPLPYPATLSLDPPPVLPGITGRCHGAGMTMTNWLALFVPALRLV